jgi:ATP-dependent helicase/DNAse subunit B
LDRVDWNPRTQEYRVVDYKNTPPQRPLAERVDRGEVHQAPLYLDLLASASPWGPDARPAGVRYEYLATNETDVFSADQWRGARETLRARRAVLWNEMLAGHFSIRPDESPGGACRFCDFARACRKAHGPSRRRAEALLSVEEEAGT